MKIDHKPNIDKICMEWIKNKYISSKIYNKKSSYALKHIFENETSHYIHNDDFIKNMECLGFESRYIPGTPNKLFKIKKIK